MSTKLQTTERHRGSFRDKRNYSLYYVNIFGSGLKSIKEEFKLQVQTGLRQTVFVIDLEDIKTELNQPRNSKMRKELKDDLNANLISAIIQSIQEFHKRYESLTKKINDELKFDLYQYWLKPNTGKKKLSLSKNEDMKGKRKVACTKTVVPKEHNKVGQPPPLSQRKYIKDEPILDKLYIIILGQMGEGFYTDLLNQNLPLDAIINFIPTESNYDIKLGNNKLRHFIAETLEIINSSIYKLRQEETTKPVGLFTHELPVISKCLAAKHCQEIFDQLTWSIYDIDMLKTQYETFYFERFKVVDVDMPDNVNLEQIYYTAESFDIQGQFQKSSLPASDADMASIAGYLNKLLNICGFQEDYSEGSQQTDFFNRFHNSFSTITNISQHNRLVVAENNRLLVNMLQYTDISQFHSIYLCCLDYNIFRPYIVLPLPEPAPKPVTHKTPPLDTVYSMKMPRYVKFYSNEDCSCQRIEELLNQYDEYTVQDVSPGYKLYTFKRIYNVLNENEGRVVIPTRLCFRDFTLYQMEEFFKELEKYEIKPSFVADVDTIETKGKALELDENIFIRSNSLKALLLQKEKRRSDGRRKSDTRSSRRLSDRKSTSSKSIFKAEELPGLPLDHPLLQGYNLEDTLQEIKYKTSDYNFYNGYVKLYEEKWCFKDMNKQLMISIRNATFIFSRPRDELKGISNNIRLITKSNINIRVLNDINECARIVMNYPNGLSLYYYDNYCEQVWYCDRSPRNEETRIFTQFGAIIVFFKAKDLITILRYNGEIYSLYQHELVDGEEEQPLSNLGDFEDKSSELDQRSQGDSFFIKPKQSTEAKKSSKQSSITSKKSRHSQKVLSEKTLGSSLDLNSPENIIKSTLYYELKFLEFLCSKYHLKYMCLGITTSQGKRVNIKHQGKIAEGRPCSITEWHDYFANESYCERDDGVKMIWTKDAFKCYHEDGTVFITAIEEDFEEPKVDEFESQISQSSSHDGYGEEQEVNEQSESKQDVDKVFVDNLFYSNSNPSSHINPGEAEEGVQLLEFPLSKYKCKSWFMQHPKYAGVYILCSNFPNFPGKIEVSGIDNIKLFTHVAEHVSQNDETSSIRTEYEDYVENNHDLNLVVNVWVGEDIHLAASKQACDICALMPPSKGKPEGESDFLTLSLKYSDYINDAYKSLIDQIASVENCKGNELEELYYIKKINSDSSIRGFEFFSTLPMHSNYKYRVSNYIIDLKAVNTIDDSLVYMSEEITNDLKKFPRFKERRPKTVYNIEEKFPRLLSATIFIEIPKKLLKMENLVHFLEPFENVNFKSLRGKFKDALTFYLKPQQQFHINKFSSSKSWENRHREHEKRLFTEKQRLGLYYAMKKHEIYPNYWLFTNICKSEAKYLEFFEFVKNKCEKKDSCQSRNDNQCPN